MRNKLILEDTPIEEFGELIYKGKNVRIYSDDAIIYAIGDNYFKKWYYDDNDSADKLFKAFQQTNSSRNEFKKCLNAFGYVDDKEIEEADFTQFVDQLEEEYEVKTDPNDVRRFSFSIQILDTDDIDKSESYKLSDIPESVRKELAKKIINNPANKIYIMNRGGND